MAGDLAGDFDRYVEAAGKALLAAMSIYDLAVSASKMMSFGCVGDDNDAWKQGPYISSGKGRTEIDRSHPYCLAISKEFSISATLVIGPNPEISSNGGARLPISGGENGFGDAEKTIAKLIMVEQFEIFRDFWMKHNGPCSKAQAKNWRGKGYDDVLDVIETLVDRRNELVHMDNCSRPEINEAVRFYYSLRACSERLAGARPTVGSALQSLMT